MKHLIVTVLFICSALYAYTQETISKPRIFVMTDISNEPDDEESLVRFLVYSNEYQVEGLVAHTSCFFGKGIREDLIRKQIKAYGLVRDNLLKHASGFPTQQELEAVTCSGQPEYGMAATGKGKSSEGSRLLITAAKKQDNRPLWITLWGGANTLAQALIDARNELSEEEFNRLISNIKVYSIADQDDAGPWIRKEFPNLFYIVDPTLPEHLSFYASTWNGISGDRHNDTGAYYHFNLVNNPWLEENIIKNHGPLGECYPPLIFIMEGDTPSFLGLINNGLGWTESPDFGGWGGRYKLYRPYGETRQIWTSNLFSRDLVEYEPGRKLASNGATIWRWRDHFQYDFAARMDWCIADSYEKANHNPIVILNGDITKDVLYIEANGREKIELSATGTKDPDGNEIDIKWWFYLEAGTVGDAVLSTESGYTTEVDLSNVKSKGGTLHVILQVNDNGTPNLYAYRRAVIKITDYTHNNPVLSGLYADPEILYSEKTNTYYIYPTSDGFTNWSGDYFKAFSSKDLRIWKDEGIILDLKKDVSWANTNAWAPCIIEKKQPDGNYKYYYYFTANKRIGVAVSDHPTGPFTDSGKPLIDARPDGVTRGQNIDPDIFTDPQTGKTYLYWGNYFMAVCELNDDMISIKPNTIKVLIPNDEFHSEGVYVFYRKGKYYFTWSKNDTRSPDYEVRYVVSDSPVGPIDASKSKVILCKDPEKEIYATGHHSILQIPGTDEWYIVYHRFKHPDGINMGKDAGYNREVCIDKLRFNNDGTIEKVVPTI